MSAVERPPVSLLVCSATSFQQPSVEFIGLLESQLVNDSYLMSREDL